MRLSIRKKTALYIAALIVLAVVLGLSFCAIFAHRYYVSIAREEMKNAYNVITELNEKQEGNLVLGHIPEEYYEELTDICEKNGFSMLISSPAGWAAFAYGNTEVLSKRLTHLIFQRDLENGEILEAGTDYIIQTINGEDGEIEYLEMWGFLFDGCSFIYRCSYSGIQNNINVTVGFYTVVCSIIMMVFSFILLVVLKTFTVPLKKLTEVTKKINEGEFETKYSGSKRRRNDEIGVLTENVGVLSHKLEQTISQLKSSNLNLKNELKNKEKLEEARKKYMSDVSHELKTPIALISGYAEGIKEGIFESKEDRDYYLDVIIDEAEKMNLMVKKLSALNQLEQGKSAVSLERFNVVEVITGFLNTMSVIIQEKDINVYFNDSDVAYVWSDEFLFEDVLVNYFNNAINHLDDRKVIRINVEKIEENIRVTVFNTGENIPEDELDKLWGKFYKVDKARTREYGGSGLGLSIVKAIADSLGKTCGVYNTPEGVAFYIELESAGGIEHAEEAEKPEKHSRLKLSEIPIWNGLQKKINGRGERHGTDQ